MNRVEFRVIDRSDPKEREIANMGLIKLRRRLELNTQRSALQQETPLSVAGVIHIIDRMIEGKS